MKLNYAVIFVSILTTSYGGYVGASEAFNYSKGSPSSNSGTHPVASISHRSVSVSEAGSLFDSTDFDRLVAQVNRAAGGGTQDAKGVKQDLKAILQSVFTEKAAKEFVEDVESGFSRSLFVHKLPGDPRHPGVNRYAFTYGYGDCPAGCIHSFTIEVEVGPDGKPKVIKPNPVSNNKLPPELGAIFKKQ